MKIFIIIPTYNEDKNIINIINGIELKYKIKNHGFIYLTEKLVISLKRNISVLASFHTMKRNIMITEYPTVFNYKKLEKSSLKYKEIINSLFGIFQIKFRKI